MDDRIAKLKTRVRTLTAAVWRARFATQRISRRDRGFDAHGSNGGPLGVLPGQGVSGCRAGR
jgi:hypothetical protein